MFYTAQYDQQISNENEFASINQENDNTTRIYRTTTTTTTIKSNKQLPEKAIHLMNTWYLEHEDNPYPNRNDLDYLATNGGIKESQVKAWFSNKRNRTQNTHPKRAKRYLIRNQTQQNSILSSNEPEKIHLADELEQRAQLLQQSNPQSLPSHSTNWSWLPSHSYDYYHQHYYYNQ
ncbi:unnamed protein product [Rotaria sordida]|uniref:Homeobox domain-containing protein n=1 Tax=Rotaria sordida TaxID=392033 RepID=A0A818IQI9_9BILA|nr:unnamed protein product [Rotaria sordida]CAF1110127.1 unnamed protein product [Rotaria sordida]CAF3528277.1 unnamed protein product [Rotaria sordida]CAF4001044.1 unnamed protein product [Rotaria sordida]